MASIINMILDKDWTTLKTYVEDKSAQHIKARIDDKKVDVLAKINKVDRSEMEKILVPTED
jgi:predicted thioesterase